MNEPLQQLRRLGQSIWYDNIRRALLDSGRLRDYVDEFSVTGITSNPMIFEQAISGGSDYDAGLREALDRDISDPEELFWDLAIRDIQDAADLLRGVYDTTAARTGSHGELSEARQDGTQRHPRSQEPRWRWG